MPRADLPVLAPAALRLGTEGAFAVLARARELERAGREVVHLEIGEPDFPTPTHVAEAAFAAIRAGETGYCPAPGIPELREAAAAELSRPRGVAIAPQRVIV
jgi:aspartate aminotransferase